MSPAVFLLCLVMLLAETVQAANEVELLLSDLIRTNNMSRVLYVTDKTRSESITVSSSGAKFLSVDDIDCHYPHLIAANFNQFLARRSGVRINIIINCETHSPVKDVLAKAFPRVYYSTVSLNLQLPLFNIVLVTDHLPGDEELKYIKLAKDVHGVLIYITKPKVKHPAAPPQLRPDCTPSQLRPVCAPYSIYKFQSRHHGNRTRLHFDVIATLTKDCVIRGVTDVMYDTFRGFNGELLRVGCIVNPIFFFKEETANGMTSYRGLYKDFVDTLAKSLNFTYEIVEPPDGNYGVPDGNGAWNGLVGMLSRQEVDLLVAGLTVTPSREEVVDFTIPFWDEKTIALYRSDRPEISWTHVFKPFQYEVWLTLAACCVTAALAMWLLQVSPFSRPTSRKHRHSLSLQDSFWNVFGGWLNQGAAVPPDTGPAHCVFICFLLTVVLVSAYYNGNLKASMTVPDRRPRHSSLADLAADDQTTIVIGKGEANRNTLESSKKGVLRDIWRRIASKPEVSLQPTFKEALTMMTSHPNTAAIGDKSHVISFLVKNFSSECNWVTLPEILYTSPYALALPEESPYKPAIDAIITQLIETGIIRKWFQEAILADTCRIHNKAAQPITLQGVRAMLLLLALGVAMATVVLVAECLKHRSVTVRGEVKGRL